jgi:hypothetical protein
MSLNKILSAEEEVGTQEARLILLLRFAVQTRVQVLLASE